MTKIYRNPLLTVDIIIELFENNEKKIVLVYRKNPPVGWALPGGFVDYGETLEHAAVREALEETTLNIELIRQMHTYSDPERDPRHHSVTTVYIAKAMGKPSGADDVEKAAVFGINNLPENIVFDHRQILDDYIIGKY